MKEKASKTKKSKIPVPENQEALAKVKEVKKEMEAYYKKNKLDPTKSSKIISIRFAKCFVFPCYIN